MKKIKIKGTVYPVKFGYGAFRILGQKWNCKGVQAVANKFQEVFPSEGSEDLEFEQGDLLGDLALAGMETAGVEDLPNRDEIVHEIMFTDPSQVEVIMAAFAESFPQQSGNPQPRKKTGKGKK